MMFLLFLLLCAACALFTHPTHHFFGETRHALLFTVRCYWYATPSVARQLCLIALFLLLGYALLGAGGCNDGITSTFDQTPGGTVNAQPQH